MISCDCGTSSVAEPGKVIVVTCPQCLPVGSISWLIDNGRQLELFGEEGVVTDVRGLESIEKFALDTSENPETDVSGLPF